MRVRGNAIKARVLAGETVPGAFLLEFFTPGMPQVLKAAGCEFAIFDMEHTGLGLETVKMLFAGCRGIGIEPMVRVPRAEYHFLARALDVGAHGVMVPMVETRRAPSSRRRITRRGAGAARPSAWRRTTTSAATSGRRWRTSTRARW